jgi:ketosteroid isomerase-like protein
VRLKPSPGVAINGLAAGAKAQSPQEDAVWKQEEAYWEYVKNFDLERYRDLWHPDFVGWPQSCAHPARKAIVTDWIVAHKGETLTYELQPAASQVFGDNLVVTHYWVTAAWDANSLKIPPQKMRITHTWMRSKDGWQIIAGMSAPDVDTTLSK